MDSKINEMCEKCQYKIAAEKNKPPDLGQMLKLAMLVSKMFGQAGEAKPPAAPDITGKSPKPHAAHHRPAVFTMDSLAEDKRIRIIKASLPYLDPTYQQLMHIVAKCLELKNIMNSSMYQSSMASLPVANQSPLGMLSAIRPHLNSQEQATMGIACKALEMLEIMQVMDKIPHGTQAQQQLEHETAEKNPPFFESIDKPVKG